MRLGTQVLVGGALLVLGALTLYLASTQGEAAVRQVPEILAAPAAHAHGTYTMLGIPEPAQLPLTGPNGTVLRPNPEFADSTVTTLTWNHGGERVFSTLTLTVHDDGNALLWTLRNETRRLPADPEQIFPPQTTSWHLGTSGQAFPVAAFTDPQHQRVWAWYAKAPEHPLQPKPSQFSGHLMTTLPDGTPLPPGALIYQVDGYTAGCSSKFLPPELQAKYASENNTAPAPT